MMEHKCYQRESLAIGALPGWPPDLPGQQELLSAILPLQCNPSYELFSLALVTIFLSALTASAI